MSSQCSIQQHNVSQHSIQQHNIPQCSIQQHDVQQGSIQQHNFPQCSIQQHNISQCKTSNNVKSHSVPSNNIQYHRVPSNNKMSKITTSTNVPECYLQMPAPWGGRRWWCCQLPSVLGTPLTWGLCTVLHHSVTPHSTAEYLSQEGKKTNNTDDLTWQITCHIRKHNKLPVTGERKHDKLPVIRVITQENKLWPIIPHKSKYKMITCHTLNKAWQNTCQAVEVTMIKCLSSSWSDQDKALVKQLKWPGQNACQAVEVTMTKHLSSSWSDHHKTPVKQLKRPWENTCQAVEVTMTKHLPSSWREHDKTLVKWLKWPWQNTYEQYE